MSDNINLVINGKACTCKKGEYLLEVIKRNGFYVPTMCHHEGLSSGGSCRICIVEIVENGHSKVVTSCIYPVTQKLEVFTDNDNIKELRGMLFTLLQRLAPNSPKIKQLADFSGIDLPRLKPKVDGDLCILCGRCVVACDSLGTGAIAKVNRGVTKQIATPYHEASSECIGCGSCVSVCPTNAIPYVQTETHYSIWSRDFEMLTCSRCGKPFVTKAEYEHLHKVQQGEKGYAQQENLEEPLCEECSKRAVARQVADAGKNL